MSAALPFPPEVAEAMLRAAVAEARRRVMLRRLATRDYRFRGALAALAENHAPEIIVSGPAGTGKTIAILHNINERLWTWPRSRWLFVRKAQADLAKTALVTFEQQILGVSHPICAGRQREGRTVYRYPNGSEVVVGGMDNLTGVMSSEYDGIYVNEAIELTEAEWETLGTRLRNGVMPYQQLIGDVNPAHPDHWILKRERRGALQLLATTHRDNPAFWDVTAQDWTAAGRNYVLNRLGALTGVRRLRLLEGKWAQAEGAVYQDFAPDIHVKPDSWLIENGWLTEDDGELAAGPRVVRVIAAQDWGYSNPACLQVWLMDGDGRACMAHEIYMSRRLADWWTAAALRLYARWRFDTLVCDPSQPAFIAQYVEAGLPATGAQNDITAGIDKVQRRLMVQPDGQPRLYLRRDALEARDPLRDEERQPCGLREEKPAYVWTAGREVPVKENDHALDTERYALCEADAVRGAAVTRNPFYG